MRYLFFLLAALLLAFSALDIIAKSSEKDHKHDDHETEGHSDEPDHKTEESHSDHPETGKEHKDHDEEKPEEGATNVGPTKGIQSFDEREGFKLSPEALRNFNIQFQPVEGASPWKAPQTALVATLDDKAVYRFRNGLFKHVDIKLTKKAASHIEFHSDDLQAGDQIVTHGSGFLRVAELDATSGESGHHH